MTKPDDEYTPEETARRMERALRRALNMPPQPHGPNPKTPPTPKPKERPATRGGGIRGRRRAKNMRRVPINEAQIDRP